MARVSAYSLSSLPVLTGVLVDALTRESIEVGSKLYGGYPGVGAVLLDVGDAQIRQQIIVLAHLQFFFRGKTFIELLYEDYRCFVPAL